MGFRQNYYKQVEKIESFKEVELESGVIFIKNPGMGALDTASNVTKTSDRMLDFIIESVYEKDEEGKLTKVFEPADKQMLFEKTTQLHTKVIQFYIECQNSLSEQNEKK